MTTVATAAGRYEAGAKADAFLSPWSRRGFSTPLRARALFPVEHSGHNLPGRRDVSEKPQELPVMAFAGALLSAALRAMGQGRSRLRLRLDDDG